MPNCFRLYAKTSPDVPAILQDVDVAICNHFHVPVDDNRWYAEWFNVIGFLIALKGHPLGSRQLRIEVAKWFSPARMPGTKNRDRWQWLCQQMQTLHFLEQHYRSDSWVEIGRRD